MIAQRDITTRWAVSDGSISIATTGVSATVTCASVNVPATVTGGVATITGAQARMLMPACGYAELLWDCGIESITTPIERVGARYCKPSDVIAYGKPNNDGFDDETRYPAEFIQAKIQEAEEAIENGTGRSFCERAEKVRLRASVLNELPVVDATTISHGELVSDRQAESDTNTMATVTYGARLNARIRAATVQLTASYLRPRSGAENARGTSMDGVFISYDLATGADGHWTGLPYVDAVIEEHKSRRVVVA